MNYEVGVRCELLSPEPGTGWRYLLSWRWTHSVRKFLPIAKDAVVIRVEYVMNSCRWLRNVSEVHVKQNRSGAAPFSSIHLLIILDNHAYIVDWLTWYNIVVSNNILSSMG